MAFTFHHVKVDYTNGNKWTLDHYKLTDLTRILSEWQIKMNRQGGWNALFWNNHDQPRAISRFTDDDKYRDQSAKLLAMVEFGLQGTPYIYQGDGIAMKNAYFTNIDQYNDHESINAYHELLKEGVSENQAIKILQQKSRENARLPMQWNSSKNYGFTTGQPWLQPVHHDDYSVEKVLKMRNNIFNFYRALIFLRKHKVVLTDGAYKLIDSDDNSVYSYERYDDKSKILVMANFTNKDQQRNVPAGLDLILGNYENIELSNGIVTLRPYESVMLEKKKHPEGVFL